MSRRDAERLENILATTGAITAHAIVADTVAVDLPHCSTPPRGFSKASTPR